jgi:hypothetical protein
MAGIVFRGQWREGKKRGIHLVGGNRKKVVVALVTVLVVEEVLVVE